MNADDRKGILYVLLGNTIFGLSFLFSKQALSVAPLMVVLMWRFVLAFVCLLIVFSMGAAGISGEVATALVSFLVTLASLSVGLGVFNLLPVPPLDGSNIIYPFMPHSFRVFMYNNGYYIQFALLILLYFGFLDTPLIFLRELVMNGMLKVLLLIF